MHIHFSNVNFSSKTGPNSFASRLAEQFTVMGHKIVENPNQNYDVFLAFIQAATQPRAKTKKILRLDGCWFKKENFEENNRQIKHCYRSFNSIIWQSEFDKKMTQKWFGKRRGHVIHNGIDLKQYPPHQLPERFEGFPEKHKYFVCSANWHGQKRLTENLRLFKRIREQLKEKETDSTLFVLGDVSPSVVEEVKEVLPLGSPERIVWLGTKSHETCSEIFSACAKSGGYMLHCAFCDHCPNSVIEALGQKLPVLYSSDGGGTKEIVQGGGIEIPSTKEYNFELTDYDHPPLINLDNFVLPDKQPEVSNNHLDIQITARRYIGCFR